MTLDELAIQRRTAITDQQRKVDYLNTLRSIVARRCPVNKVGVAIVSDYDLLDATAEEIAEALAKIQAKPSKQ